MSWFPMPRYRVTLAARLTCRHVVWAYVVSAWPQAWVGPLYCERCNRAGEVEMWWHIR